MAANIHAVLLLCVGSTAVAIPLWSRKVVGRSLALVLLCVIPSLFVGLLSSLTLNAGGKPLLEWLLPALVALSSALFWKSNRLSIAFGMVMGVAALLLSMNFLNLVKVS